ncbi:hypothetical protein [Streptomyces sp. NPDC048603]|uniref:hypothetical protein n=1 Tax=Streptomyces sp. NPDC048603 TaxID=3365577 RepID=UPI00371FA117
MSYMQWEDIYEEAWKRPASLAGRRCPECGREDLNLIFIAWEMSDGKVSAALWCGACLHGISICNGIRPKAGHVWSRDDAERERPVPNFTLIPPEWTP